MSYIVRKLIGNTVAPPSDKKRNQTQQDELDRGDNNNNNGSGSNSGRRNEGSSDGDGDDELLSGTPFVHSAAVQSPTTATAANPKGNNENNSKRPPPISRPPTKSAGDSSSPVRKVPTRTLIQRIQTCTVVQERRDAFRDLSECDDVAYVMGAKEVAHITHAIRTWDDDDGIIVPAFGTLAAITDLDSYRQTSTYNISDREKKQIRDSFVHELVQDVPLFLPYLEHKEFWVRYNVVQILQRLQDYDPSKVNQLLLASHGIGLVVNVLNDNTHDGVLRNEGLLLLTSLTSTDQELQTILAFDNAFESLFAIIKAEGGLHGGVIVSDCLTIIHNMLRQNKATQKLFREMGCAAHLNSIMSHVTDDLKQQRRGARASEAPPVAPLGQMSSMIAFMAVAILSCMLREGDANDDGHTTRTALEECGILDPLATVALCGHVVDDGTSIEAMRTLASLLDGNNPAVKKFIDLKISSVVRLENNSEQVLNNASAMMLVVRTALFSTDVARQMAGAKVVESLLSVPTLAANVGHALIHGFSPSSVPAQPFRVEIPAESGKLLNIALFATGESSSTLLSRYYGALLLEKIIAIPTLRDELLVMPCGSDLNGRNTSADPGVFFAQYAKFVIGCVVGEHKSNLSTSCALFRPLLSWLLTCPRAMELMLNGEPSLYSVFLRGATHSAPSHLRLLCVLVGAVVCVNAPREQRPNMAGGPNPRDGGQRPSLFDRKKLVEAFVNAVGSGSLITDLIYDVQATCPEWQNPPASAWLSNPPVLYDNQHVQRLQAIVKDFKDSNPYTAGTYGGPQHEVQPAPRPAYSHHEESKEVGQFLSPMLVSDRSEARAGNHSLLGHHIPADCTSPNAAANSSDPGNSYSYNHPSPDAHPGGHVPKPHDTSLNDSAFYGRTSVREDDSLKAAHLEVERLLQRNKELEETVLQLRRAPPSHGSPDAAHEMGSDNAVERIALLEEALQGKEEDVQQLLKSLNHLEETLRNTRSSRDEVEVLHQQLSSAQQERNELLLLVAEQDEELQALRMHGAGMGSVPQYHNGSNDEEPSPSAAHFSGHPIVEEQSAEHGEPTLDVSAPQYPPSSMLPGSISPVEHHQQHPHPTHANGVNHPHEVNAHLPQWSNPSTFPTPGMGGQPKQPHMETSSRSDSHPPSDSYNTRAFTHSTRTLHDENAYYPGSQPMQRPQQYAANTFGGNPSNPFATLSDTTDGAFRGGGGGEEGEEEYDGSANFGADVHSADDRDDAVSRGLNTIGDEMRAALGNGNDFGTQPRFGGGEEEEDDPFASLGELQRQQQQREAEEQQYRHQYGNPQHEIFDETNLR